MRPRFSIFPSPIGWIGVVAGTAGVAELCIHLEREEVHRRLAHIHPGARFEEALDVKSQLLEYFAGTRRSFDLPVDIGALPPFSRRILESLADVPFGTTLTYGQLADKAGRPGAARAVGRAMATNPLPIILPCHRVVGAGGRMTGYSGGNGVATKRWLLRFEEAPPFTVSESRGEVRASVKNS